MNSRNISVEFLPFSSARDFFGGGRTKDGNLSKYHDLKFYVEMNARYFTSWGVQGKWVIIKMHQGRLLMTARDEDGQTVADCEFIPNELNCQTGRFLCTMDAEETKKLGDHLRSYEELRGIFSAIYEGKKTRWF